MQMAERSMSRLWKQPPPSSGHQTTSEEARFPGKLWKIRVVSGLKIPLQQISSIIFEQTYDKRADHFYGNLKIKNKSHPLEALAADFFSDIEQTCV